MKFRTIVFLFIIAAIAIGIATKPGPEAFKEFYAKQSGITAPPVIEYTNGVAYSVFSVRSFTIKSGGPADLAIPVGKSKYLGLFGRFWKMD